MVSSFSWARTLHDEQKTETRKERRRLNSYDIRNSDPCIQSLSGTTAAGAAAAAAAAAVAAASFFMFISFSFFNFRHDFVLIKAAFNLVW